MRLLFDPLPDKWRGRLELAVDGPRVRPDDRARWRGEILAAGLRPGETAHIVRADASRTTTGFPAELVLVEIRDGQGDMATIRMAGLYEILAYVGAAVISSRDVAWALEQGPAVTRFLLGVRPTDDPDGDDASVAALSRWFGDRDD